jgi:5-methylcytosine-specific restriction enzyme A
MNLMPPEWDEHILAARRRRTERQLEGHPLCAWCLQRGVVVVATVAEPTTVFYDDTEGLFGEMQSLCADCSNRKRTPNGLGYVDDIGLDGYPVDPRHPFNRPRS